MPMKSASDFVSSDSDWDQSTESYSKKSARRRKAIQQKMGGATAARQAVGTLRGQAAEAQKAIRFGASQATAAGMQPGMGGGGGIMAAAGQVGREAEMAGIGQRSRDTERIIAAEQMAAQKGVEAEEYAAQQGDEGSDFQEAFAEGQTEAEQAIQDSQGFWDDDEAAAFRKIRAMIARIRVKSPNAARKLEQHYLQGAGRDRINSAWD